MLVNMVGAFIRNFPFGTEIAFKKGLERRGVEVNAIDPSYPDQIFMVDADATIVFKWMDSYLGQLHECSGVKIVYQPDDARFPHIRNMIAGMRDHVDHFLSFDDFGSRVAREMGYKNAETLLLTADDELYCPASDPIARDIEVSFVGSLTGGSNHASRLRMCQMIRREADRRRWRTWFGSTENITEILDIYRRSKVVLNHATDVGQDFGSGFGLQCRHFEVGMTKTALISNQTIGTPHTNLPFLSFSDDRTLIEAVEWIVYDEERWINAGRALYDAIMSSHKPEHRADQLIDFIRRCS